MFAKADSVGVRLVGNPPEAAFASMAVVSEPRHRRPLITSFKSVGMALAKLAASLGEFRLVTANFERWGNAALGPVQKSHVACSEQPNETARLCVETVTTPTRHFGRSRAPARAVFPERYVKPVSRHPKTCPNQGKTVEVGGIEPAFPDLRCRSSDHVCPAQRHLLTYRSRPFVTAESRKRTPSVRPHALATPWTLVVGEHESFGPSAPEEESTI
jgi:hypothetical protein